MKCEYGDDNSIFYEDQCSGKGRCCICGSRECTLVRNIHDVQPQELNKMCEKFRSVLGVDSTDTTWAYDCFDRETGGLDMDVRNVSNF